MGDEVILLEIRYEDGCKSKWRCGPHTGEGIGGNTNPAIKHYHGWRGTFNGAATYVYGVRKVIKVSTIDDGLDIHQKIPVGRDLHPDWE